MKKVVSTTKAPGAIGPYSQAIIASPNLFLSGQVPLDPTTAKLVSDDLTEQTHQVMQNLSAVLKEANSSFDQVIKTTIYLTDMSHFETVNKIYAEYFKPPYPARVTVAVKELPCKALVEIDALASTTDNTQNS